MKKPYDEWMRDLIAYAKRVYNQDLDPDEPAWRPYYDDGDSPEDAMDEDMSYGASDVGAGQ